MLDMPPIRAYYGGMTNTQATETLNTAPLMVSTYVPISGVKSARIVGASGTVLITRDRWKVGVWECWRSDSTRVMYRGSFRSCVAVARRAVGIGS